MKWIVVYKYWVLALGIFSLTGVSSSILGGDSSIRVVSLAPNITEMIYYIGAGSNLVGITDYCNYPKNVPGGVGVKPKVGGMQNPNLEKILSLKPGLVLMTEEGNRKETFLSLKNLGIKTKGYEIPSIADVLDTINKLGQLLKKSEETKRQVQLLKDSIQQLEKVHNTQKKVPLIWVYSLNPLIVAGKGTFVNEMIEIAGGKNVMASSTHIKYPRIAIETVLRLNPSFIIHSMDPQMKGEISKFWRRFPSIKAVDEKKIFFINPDIVDRPGPRLLQGIVKIAHLLKSQDGEP